MRAYRMRVDSDLEPKATAGTMVYDIRGWDYGLASDDTRHTGIEHKSVTLKSDGDYPSFTVKASDIEPIDAALAKAGAQ